ncbi:MAG: MBL fold metallo-hydrolase [Gammaproteobacteria bacterium]
MKRILIALGLSVTLVMIIGYAAFRFSPAVQDAVVARAIRAQMDRTNRLPRGDDALRILLCGTSSPMPLRAAAKSCTLIAAGQQLFLIDIGPESSENLALWRVPIAEVEHVFLTHFHSDHIGELGEFNMQSWVQGRRSPLQVHGPDGVEQVVAGFNDAYALDRSYRNAHHDRGRGLLPLDAGVMTARRITDLKAGETPRGRRTVVYERDGVVVTAIEVDHRPVTPALAYRFDYRGRSVVITGDTVLYAPLTAATRGADVLVSEAESHHLQNLVADQAAAMGARNLARVLRDTTDYHIDPLQAARLANEAGVRELVYTHIAPPIVAKPLEIPWLRGVSEIRAQGVRLGRDGMLITVPLDGGPIRFDQL